MSVVLTIDRLVLDDWTGGSADAALVRAAVEQAVSYTHLTLPTNREV